jgi:hypothetical protein
VAFALEGRDIPLLGAAAGVGAGEAVAAGGATDTAATVAVRFFSRAAAGNKKERIRVSVH